MGNGKVKKLIARRFFGNVKKELKAGNSSILPNSRFILIDNFGREAVWLEEDLIKLNKLLMNATVLLYEPTKENRTFPLNKALPLSTDELKRPTM